MLRTGLAVVLAYTSVRSLMRSKVIRGTLSQPSATQAQPVLAGATIQIGRNAN